MPNVNPEILLWARETAGLSPETAVKKLGLKGAKGISATDRLYELESGANEPSRPMLVKMAKQYRRPLLTFYLSSPPARGDRGEDFRTLPADYDEAENALLDVLIRQIKARQSMVRAVLEEEDEAEVRSFIGSLTIENGIPAFLSTMNEILGLSRTEFRAENSPIEAFARLREKAENIGIFVLLKGDLGSYHTSIDLKTFRGFSAADEVAPFIVINDQDSRAAWSFTLLHEIAHLLMGQSGVSGSIGALTVEKFCNDLAGEYLLPNSEIVKRFQAIGSGSVDPKIISNYARQRNVSSTMVAYKLYRTGIISEETWKNLRNEFRHLWVQEQERKRALGREQDGGPTFYIIRRHRVGKALINLVKRMVAAGAITTSKAGKVLGVKPTQVQSLLHGSS